MIATFCGHRAVENRVQVEEWIHAVTETLILDGTKTFYLGGYGEFDRLAKLALQKHKKRYAYVDIVLILPYLNSRMDTAGYDYTLYPPIETVPKRLAIVKRNEWMVAQSESVVAYVLYNFGGAAKTLEFAKRKSKHILMYSHQAVK